MTEMQPLATPREVANYLRMSEMALAQMRFRKTGPPFYRVGDRRVMYRWSEVYDWVQSGLNAPMPWRVDR